MSITFQIALIHHFGKILTVSKKESTIPKEKMEFKYRNNGRVESSVKDLAERKGKT
jgi:hypothetical protein